MCTEPGYGEPIGSDGCRRLPPPPVPTPDNRCQRNTFNYNPLFNQTGTGAVLMVYGLDPLRTNADKLFNLMCLYGNVLRVNIVVSNMNRKYLIYLNKKTNNF